MKDTETKRKCLELRAQGKSFKAIGEIVGVRRQTVANWVRADEEEVKNLWAMELDAIREECWMTTQARIERKRARLEQITAELDTRDFSDVPTAKLVELERTTRAELAREFADLRVCSEEELQAAKAQRTTLEQLSEWAASDATPSPDADDSGNGQRRSRRANPTDES